MSNITTSATAHDHIKTSRDHELDIYKTSKKCLLVSYRTLAKVHVGRKRRSQQSARPQTLPDVEQDTPRTPSTHGCNESARKRSCSQHKASHNHLKKR